MSTGSLVSFELESISMDAQFSGSVGARSRVVETKSSDAETVDVGHIDGTTGLTKDNIATHKARHQSRRVIGGGTTEGCRILIASRELGFEPTPGRFAYGDGDYRARPTLSRMLHEQVMSEEHRQYRENSMSEEIRTYLGSHQHHGSNSSEHAPVSDATNADKVCDEEAEAIYRAIEALNTSSMHFQDNRGQDRER